VVKNELKRTCNPFFTFVQETGQGLPGFLPFKRPVAGNDQSWGVRPGLTYKKAASLSGFFISEAATVFVRRFSPLAKTASFAHFTRLLADSHQFSGEKRCTNFLPLLRPDPTEGVKKRTRQVRSGM